MGHGWKVNPNGTTGHCKQHTSRHDDKNKACVMVPRFFHEFGVEFAYEDNHPAPEFYDGEVAYHEFVNNEGLPTEYLDIRYASEPVPSR
jgi:hypothetical protein